MVTANSVNLIWPRSKNPGEYTVYKRTNKLPSQIIKKLEGNTLQLLSLTPRTTYEFMVQRPNICGGVDSTTVLKLTMPEIVAKPAKMDKVTTT